MKTKHTPGEWRISPFRNAENGREYIEITTDFRESEDHINVIAKLFNYNYDKRTETANYSQDETNQLANAKIMAAAKIMLKALEFSLEFLKQSDIPSDYAEQYIEDVIKKATE